MFEALIAIAFAAAYVMIGGFFHSFIHMISREPSQWRNREGWEVLSYFSIVLWPVMIVVAAAFIPFYSAFWIGKAGAARINRPVYKLARKSQRFFGNLKIRSQR